MKIVVGIDKVSDIVPLLKAGANDFFCGLVDNKNRLINHRPNTLKYNIKNTYQLKNAINIAHNNKCKLFLVLNDTVCDDKEKKIILDKIKKLDKFNIDGFIVKDISFIYFLKKNKIKTNLHLSSLAACFNSESIKFYKSFGVSRIIIPQQLSPFEYSLFENKIKNIETEVFFHLYNSCINIDGICRYHDQNLFQLKKEVPFMPCLSKVKIRSFPFIQPGITKNIKKGLQKPPIYDSMGYLYDFYKLGIKNIKLGIRGYPIEEKIKMVTHLKKILNLIDKGISKDKFLNKINKKHGKSNINK